MIWAVLDTNILVSGTIMSRGAPYEVLEAAWQGRFRLVTSPAILDEVTRALHRDRIKRKYQLRDSEIQRTISLLEHEAIVTSGTLQVAGIATHPEDDRILATALEGGAQVLVTGDLGLRRIGHSESVVIVTAVEFLKLLNDLEPTG